MITLDELLNSPTESFEHPLLRGWKARLARPGTTARLEILRDAPDLGQAYTEMFIHFSQDGEECPPQTRPWDDDLNAGLIELGVPAISAEQEATRFALGLNAAMRKAARESGDGFFNSVLVDLLKDSDLTRYPEIDEVLKFAPVSQPHREGRPGDRYSICRDMIAIAIGGRAKELRDRLHYSQEESKKIIAAALAQFLDQRFSVSYRKRLGLV